MKIYELFESSSLPDADKLDKSCNSVVDWYTDQCEEYREDYGKDDTDGSLGPLRVEIDDEILWNSKTRTLILHVIDVSKNSFDEGVYVRIKEGDTNFQLIPQNEVTQDHPLAQLHDDPDVQARVRQLVGTYVKLSLSEII